MIGERYQTDEQQTTEDLIAEINAYGSNGITEIERTFGITDAGQKPVKASDVKPETEPAFLFYPYIALHDLTVISAAGGTGKSIALCGLAACFSTGDLPTGERIEPVNTLFISSEDSEAVIAKRLKASNANMDKITIVDKQRSLGINLCTDLKRLEYYIVSAREPDEVKQPLFVVIDPLQSFIPDINMNAANEIRPILNNLAITAKTYNCAIVIVTHMNKGTHSANANNATMGSSDIINRPRSALQVVFAGENTENTRAIVHTKVNDAAYGDSLAFEITDEAGIIWTGYSNITRSILEQSATLKKPAWEIAEDKAESDLKNRRVINAILAEAKALDEQKSIFVPYQSMIDKYGENIFENRRKKSVVIRRAAYELHKMHGIIIDIPENPSGHNGRGFYIYKA